MNFELARFNMVEQQIRTWEVLDARVLELIARSPREDYVPAAYRNLAFTDMQIPIGHGQVMMEPKLEARLVQELNLQPSDVVLEIGTGSGYVTSLLAGLAGRVFSVEINETFSREAAEKLAGHGINNVTLEIGDAARGWAAHAPYNAILATGSYPILPPELKAQLKVGGRLAVVVGEPPVMEAKLIRRLSEQGFDEVSLFDTDLPPLMNAPRPPKFVF